MDKEEECIICTENLINARKLSCNHYFHLICLSKWIEKGNKSCPICRKEIDFHNQNINNLNSNNGIWSFGLRLDGRFFSWLPNITFRIIRINGGNNNTNNLNAVNTNPIENLVNNAENLPLNN